MIYMDENRGISYIKLLVLSVLITSACMLPKPRVSSDTLQMRQYIAELGFTYGVNWERYQRTGDTNYAIFSLKDLEKVVESITTVKTR